METTEITTPVGNNKVALKQYITGRDMRSLREIYLKVGTLDSSGQNLSNIDPAMVDQSENKAFEMVIVSIDGQAEGILDKILNMPAQDYDFILTAVNEITAGLSKKK